MHWVDIVGIITDKSAIQFKMLNKSKGPAMWSPRAQNDRMRFAEEWRLALENTPNCDFYQEMVKGLLIENGKVSGVRTSLGIDIKGPLGCFNQRYLFKWINSYWRQAIWWG